jgi:hypothetical protein
VAVERARTKPEALDRLCRVLDVPEMGLSPGSTIPAEIFYLVARQLGIEPEGSMPILGEAIAHAAGLEWGRDCDSRHTKSGGGSTVTLVGMNRMIEALEASVATPAPVPPGSPNFGQTYVTASGGVTAPDGVVSRNWDALDRATRAHAETQNALAVFVHDHGLTTVTPRLGIDPAFDVGWHCDLGLVVAEVKTVTPQNRRQQVRLGLGQVLDYRWNVAQSRDVRVFGVLATNAPIADDEAAFCTVVGVTTTSPRGFASDLASLLTPP